MPSFKEAHVFFINSEEGSAITCLLISISLLIFIPLKGEFIENSLIVTGVDQLRAPPNALESIDLSVTGSKSVSAASRFGPANLINIPPFLIQSFSFTFNSSLIVPTPGSIITEVFLSISSSRLPILTILKDLIALSK